MKQASSVYTTNERWRAFAVVSVAVFISILDLFIVNIGMPDIQREWPDAGLSRLSWVLTGYAIALAALLVPLGKIGDILGRRRVFEVGVLTFVLGSALCALSPNPEILIAARVLQGVGAAALTPTSLGLLLPLFPLRERAAVIGAWAALGGVGAATGPPLGGVLVQASWRWIFIVNIPLGLYTTFAVRRRFAEVRDAGSPLPDAVGATLLMLCVGLLTLGLVQGPSWDWDERVVGSFVVGALSGILLVLRSRRHRAPVLELELFRAPSFAFASASTFVFFAGFAGLLLGGVLFLTDVWHYSVLRAGLGFAPGPIMAAVFAAPAGRLAQRFGPAIIGAPGGLLFAIGTAWMTGLGPDPAYASEYLPTMIVGGIGVGLILPSFTASAMMAVRPERLATGIAAETTFRQIGAALGVGAWVAIFGAPAADGVLDAFDRGFVFMAVTSFVAGLTLLVLHFVLRGARGAAAEAAGTPATETP